MKYITSNKIA